MTDIFAKFQNRVRVDTQSLLGEEDPEEEPDLCSFLPSLSMQQRIGGCVSCMILGYMLSLGASFRLVSAFRGDVFPLVIVLTFGNIISLSGSCFLAGPTSQLEKMFHSKRRIASIAYISSLVLTLTVAFALEGIIGQGLLLIFLILCQYISIGWYCMSYIPFARQMVSKCWSYSAVSLE